MSISLFCYGTLQSEQVIKTVTGNKYKGIKALLHDYSIFYVQDTEYPGIIPKKGDIVKGMIYNDIDDQSLKILDKFEGDQYIRKVLTVVRQDNNTPVKVYTYCIKDDHINILTDNKWDIDHFLKHGINSFMENFVEGRRNFLVLNNQNNPCFEKIGIVLLYLRYCQL